jgi:hypothetical protein
MGGRQDQALWNRTGEEMADLNTGKEEGNNS